MNENYKKLLQAMRVYGIITEDLCRAPWLETARSLAGEVDILQLREKNITDCEMLARAVALKDILSKTRTLLVINDRPDIALLSGADGVHLGQDDIPPAEARRLLGGDFIIGVSTHSVEQAIEAERNGADYIGVGPVFETDTKKVKTGIGTETAAKMCSAVSLPTVAIGGIKANNAAEVAKTATQSVAAVSALCSVECPAHAAAGLRAAFERGRGGL